ncbi:hypothetical protein HMPREF3032_00276 [Veillonella sp. DNF00869]|nr:hypothetical protein HMPREF3032_00276 [Veillonella sp. DNF00869]
MATATRCCPLLGIPILLDIAFLLLYSTYESMYIKLAYIMKAIVNTMYA